MGRARRWPQDGLRRTTLQAPKQDVSEMQMPERTFSTAKCLLNRKTARLRRRQMPNVRSLARILFPDDPFCSTR